MTDDGIVDRTQGVLKIGQGVGIDPRHLATVEVAEELSRVAQFLGRDPHAVEGRFVAGLRLAVQLAKLTLALLQQGRSQIADRRIGGARQPALARPFPGALGQRQLQTQE